MTHLLKFSEQVKWHIKLEDSRDAAGCNAWDLTLMQAVSGFSQYILKQVELRGYPEIIALAFWFRASNIEKLAQSACSQSSDDINAQTSSAKVFHIAPANVDTVFIYSVLLSVLCGNQNIVRVSERSGDITWVLIELLKQYLTTASGYALRNKIAITQYSAQQESVTEQFSHWCDLRVIWGGDSAIDAITKIAPQTKQICFPDRFSISVFKLTKNTDLKATAKAFLTDLLPFNQQACSSPKAIYWLNTPTGVQVDFWQAVNVILRDTEHQLGLSNKVEQHILLQKLAAKYAIELNQDIGKKVASFAKLQSVGQLGHCKVKTLTADMLAEHSGNGLIFEVDIDSIEQLPYSMKLQTISLAGNVEQIKAQLSGEYKRSVMLGHSLVFDSVWDGVDLIKIFSNIQS